jgi:hypothetical protein
MVIEMNQEREFLNSILGKIVEIKYNAPSESGSTRDSYPTEGRVVKLYKNESRFLMVNPECMTEEDVSSKGLDLETFKWGVWVYLDEASVVVKT